MRRILRALALAALSLTWALPAGAQVSDHLKCFKVKDPIAKAAYTVNLSGFAPDTGCIVKVPGKLLCVETAKTVVGEPVPPGAGPGNPAGRFLCYKVKCPKTSLQNIPWTDQFGARPLQQLAPPKLLCAPEPATTTTTTTTSSTTTMTGPPCVTGGCGCCGSCGDGRCHLTGGGGGCGTIDNTPQCVSASSCTEVMCNSHGQCPAGQVCVFTGSGIGSLCCDPCP
jgi:hypothetical protein